MSFFKKLFGIKEKDEESVFPKPYIAPPVTRSTPIEKVLENNEPESFDTDYVNQNSETKKTTIAETKKTEVTSKIMINTVKSGSNPDDWDTFEKNGKEGYEDEDGNVVIEAQFDSADLFEEGVAVVKIGEKRGMINARGEYILKPEYDYIYGVTEGLILVEKNDLSGFVSSDGTFVIPLMYDYASEFSEGLSSVSLDGKCGFIDTNNKTIINFNFGDAGDFSQGLACASPYSELETTKYGYIDKSGEFVIQPKFDDAKGFRENLAPVKVGDKWGYANLKGDLICEPQYFRANEFYHGRSSVMKETNGKSGFADKTGKLVIDYLYDYQSDFMETGKAYVFIKGECLTLNPDGTYKK